MLSGRVAWSIDCAGRVPFRMTRAPRPGCRHDRDLLGGLEMQRIGDGYAEQPVRPQLDRPFSPDPFVIFDPPRRKDIQRTGIEADLPLILHNLITTYNFGRFTYDLTDISSRKTDCAATAMSDKIKALTP